MDLLVPAALCLPLGASLGMWSSLLLAAALSWLFAADFWAAARQLCVPLAVSFYLLWLRRALLG